MQNARVRLLKDMMNYNSRNKRKKRWDNIQIRRAQAIYTWGIGSTLDTANGYPVMLAGLDAWDVILERIATNPEKLRFNDVRLQNRLGVDHFVLPFEHLPAAKYRGRNPDNHSLSLPFVSFPQWYYCTSCKLMDKTKSLFDNVQMNCQEKNCYRQMVPSRFVCICEEGHIQDFPFVDWVHMNNENVSEVCTSPKLKFSDRGGLDLKDIYINCVSCNSSRSLAGMKDGMRKNFKCKGHRPWLNDLNDHECDAELHATLRNASNVHNPIIKKSIYLANSIKDINQRAAEVVEEYSYMINPGSDGKLSKEVLEAHSVGLSNICKIDKEEIKKAIIRKFEYESENNDDVTLDISEEEYRYKEFKAIKEMHESLELKLENAGIENYKNFNSVLDNVIMVHRLRETMAYCGFTRISPPSESSKNTKKAMNQLRLNPYKMKKEDKWLPAIWSRGEGIFIEFNKEKLSEWSKNSNIKKHLTPLLSRYRQYFDTFENIDQNFILIHTFAHILVNQIAFECGYGSSSIKERLYFSSSENNPMNGVLIYTTGDTEGSLGGLVRLGRPGTLENILESAIEKARWCSTDPVCLDSKGQGPDGCNLAACYNCALISETSCENGNRLLDRSLLINPDFGYFSVDK
tara:strand:- start:4517 stop:6406 length:1890 start_codon:yes stop_codon:yes gene_type:complete